MDDYLLGHSDDETQRLIEQAELLAPFTRRILAQAGIGPGMRVLDVGTGMGDVAFIAAEMVGPEGSVVAIDTSPVAIESARRRLGTGRFGNVSFAVSDPADLPKDETFDAVVGRYVLMFLPDPIATLSGLRKRLGAGGRIAFHELDWSGARSHPAAPTYDRVCRWVAEALRLGGADAHMGSHLYSALVQAGYPAPQMSLESIIGGPDDPSGAVRRLFRTVLPEAFVAILEQHGIADSAATDLKTLRTRLMAEITALGSVIISRSEVGVWASRP